MLGVGGQVAVGTAAGDSRVVARIGLAMTLVCFLNVHCNSVPIHFLVAVHGQLLTEGSLSPLHRHWPGSVVGHSAGRGKPVLAVAVVVRIVVVIGVNIIVTAVIVVVVGDGCPLVVAGERLAAAGVGGGVGQTGVGVRHCWSAVGTGVSRLLLHFLLLHNHWLCYFFLPDYSGTTVVIALLPWLFLPDCPISCSSSSCF